VRPRRNKARTHTKRNADLRRRFFKIETNAYFFFFFFVVVFFFFAAGFFFFFTGIRFWEGG
jgi:hypothetical protein